MIWCMRVFLVCAVVSQGWSGDAPVYIDPNAPVVEPVRETKALPSYVTKTVYGFLDFVTTISNTVMVFKPGTPPEPEPTQTVSPSPTVSSATKTQLVEKLFSHTPTVELEGLFNSASISPSENLQSSIEEFSTIDPHLNYVLRNEDKVTTLNGNAILLETQSEPEFDYLLRETVPEVRENGPIRIEPSKSIRQRVESRVDVRVEVRDETGVRRIEHLGNVEVKSEVNEVKPSNSLKPVQELPTGLVTKLGGTLVKDGVTTVHETQVIGTFIDGKYAQVLRSTSSIFIEDSELATPIAPVRVSPTAIPILHTPKAEERPLKSVFESEEFPVMSTAASNRRESIIGLEELFSPALSRSKITLRHTDVNPTPSYRKRPHTERPPEPSSRRQAASRRQQAKQAFLSRLRNSQKTFKRNEDPMQGQGQVLSPTTVVRPSYRQSARFRPQRVSPTPKLPDPISTHYAYRQQSSRFTRRRYTPTHTQKYTPKPTHRYTRSRTPPLRTRYTPKPVVTPTYSYDYDDDYYYDDYYYEEDSAPTTVRGGYTKKYGQSSYIRPSSSSLYRFQLSRPTTRWSYRTSPKPKVQIKPNGALDKKEPTEEAEFIEDYHDPDGQEVGVGTVELVDESDVLQPSIETLRVETSTPSPDMGTIYEVATIKSMYTFKVGTVLNTRFITLTTTLEKPTHPLTLEEEASEVIQPTEVVPSEIQLTQPPDDLKNEVEESNDIDATLPPIGLSGDATALPFERVTETYSTSEVMMKKSLLPVLSGAETQFYTLTQSYYITRLVTAYKTMPPHSIYQFLPDQNLNEFNTQLQEAGSENQEHLHPLGDEDLPLNQQVLDPELATIGSEFDIADFDKPFQTQVLPPVSKKTPEIKPTPASVAVQQQQPTLPGQLPQVPGLVPSVNPAQIQQMALLQRLYNPYLGLGQLGLPPPINPLNPIAPAAVPTQVARPVVTSWPVTTATTVLSTSLKIFTILFGNKHSLTTVSKVTEIPTIITTYSSSTIGIQPTALPGVAPYLQFPGFGR